MAKNLVIVESPTKAKMLTKFLGDDYVVESSFGHIRDLPQKKSDLTSSQKALPYASLGIDVDNNFKPLYVVPQKSKKYATKLRQKFGSETVLWLATDEDREGEAIAWHLLEILKPKKGNTIQRIVFHEITKDAILEAIKNPREIDMNLVNAQQARRILDRLVGYRLSPLLWKKIKYGLSAGRVQSVAVRLLVDREREIKAFDPEESWSLTAHFQKDEKNFTALFQKIEGKKVTLRAEEEARAVLGALKDQKFLINSVSEKQVKRRPAPPFTTSTLQQEAARKLGFSVRKTMQLAQKLYEGIDMEGGEAGGLITYMRTDSVNLSEKALADAQRVIAEKYGAKFSETRVYKTKSKGAQEAHEAVRPTEISRTPDQVNQWKSTLDSDARKLYDLIWKRTMASQMTDAELLQTGIDLDVKARVGDQKVHTFRATGQRIVFDGFLKVYAEGRDDEKDENKEDILPKLTQNEELGAEKIEKKQHFTKPPPRYTEASLVKKLEAEGIGRPSTYAPTITTIMRREYAEREGKQLVPTDIAFVVIKLLEKHFERIVSLKFTAGMEEHLDEIAEGKLEWHAMLEDFYEDFDKQVEEKEENISVEEARAERILGTDPKSGKPLKVRMGRYGPHAQIGSRDDAEKPKFAGLRKGQSLDTITLEEALELFKLPRTLGADSEGNEIKANIGRFGPYVQVEKLFVSLKEDDPMDVTLERALELIAQKKEEIANRIIKEFKDTDIQILNGRYGPYITDGKKNAKIPKEHKDDPAKLTRTECEKLISEAPEKGRRWKKKK